MRVTLVYHGRYFIRQALELETLASVLRQAGHRVTMVYDPDVFGVTDNVLQIPRLARWFASPKSIARKIIDSQPEAIVYSVLPETFNWTRKVAPLVRAVTPAPSVFVGLHPSLVPERVMEENIADYVIQGEVENVILPLLTAVEADRPPHEVGNLWFRHEGQLVQTERADLVDMDALPLPDKELFRPFVSHSFTYAAMVSRGCPYQCTFCEETCSKQLYGGRYFRRKSVDSVMQELIAGKKRYHYREVIFKDSYLSGNKKWLTELMDRYAREIGVPFKCFCTIHSFDDETARLLKEGGCYSIEFGLQTWNADIRKNILKRVETNEDALRAFKHCADHKLWYDVDHMFNLPYETERDYIESADYYRRLRYLNRVKVHYLQYLPTADIVEHGIAAEALPRNVREKLADGWETNFYDQSIDNEEQAGVVSGFAALYKLLPGLPDRALDWLLAKDRVRMLGRLPSPVMALLQGLLALRSGDLRFMAFLSLYPAKICRAVLER